MVRKSKVVYLNKEYTENDLDDRRGGQAGIDDFEQTKKSFNLTSTKDY